MYLPPDAQDRLFDHITALSAPGSRLATEHIPDMGAFRDDRTAAWRARWRRYGLDIDVAELVWDGERSHVTDYLSAHGWRLSVHGTEQLYAANGFQFPDDEAMASFRDLSYVSAELNG